MLKDLELYRSDFHIFDGAHSTREYGVYIFHCVRKTSNVDSYCLKRTFCLIFVRFFHLFQCMCGVRQWIGLFTFSISRALDVVLVLGAESFSCTCLRACVRVYANNKKRRGTSYLTHLFYYIILSGHTFFWRCARLSGWRARKRRSHWSNKWMPNGSIMNYLFSP